MGKEKKGTIKKQGEGGTSNMWMWPPLQPRRIVRVLRFPRRAPPASSAPQTRLAPNPGDLYCRPDDYVATVG